MAFNVKYPLDISTIEGDGKQSGFTKLINEFIWLYGLLSGLFSPSTGHKHTGAVNDGPKLGTSSYGDGTVTLAKLATDATTAINAIPSGIPPKGGAIPFIGTFGGTGNKFPMEDGSPRLDWHICDGTDGTIPLQDKFIVGAGNLYVVGATGGEVNHTLTINEMPSHDHAIGISWSDNSNGANDSSSYPLTLDGSKNTSLTGGGLAHNNLPPYYALCYIQRIS